MRGPGPGVGLVDGAVPLAPASITGVRSAWAQLLDAVEPESRAESLLRARLSQRSVDGGVRPHSNRATFVSSARQTPPESSPRACGASISARAMSYDNVLVSDLPGAASARSLGGVSAGSVHGGGRGCCAQPSRAGNLTRMPGTVAQHAVGGRQQAV